MSAGNYVLSSNAYAPTTTPYSTTLLGTGNYWIEEIDFALAYINTTVASTFSLVFQLTDPGVFWYQYLSVVQSAAGITQLNTVVISRPRIFLPRAVSVGLSFSGPNANMSQIVFSLNIYGRQLP